MIDKQPILRSIDGTHYTVYGEGKNTLVLLRGLGRWSEHWMGFAERIADSGIRVIAVDNRGFGHSGQAKLDKSLKISDFADDVALIIAKEAPYGATVVGVSLGGMIALALASMKPQLVRQLIIVNSSIAGAKLPRISRKATLALLGVIIGSKKAYQKLASILLGPSADLEKKSRLANEWSIIDARAKPNFKNFWAQLMAAKSFGGFSELAAIKCPATIIKSEGDMFVDPKNSEFIHKQLKGSELLRHPSAGHELAFDDPEWFAAVIKRVAGHQTA